MTSDWLDQLLLDALARRTADHLLRTRLPLRPLDATHVEIDGRRCINFASNDYLGLSHHPLVIAALKQALERCAGAGASPLVTGYTTTHAEAESALAAWKGVEACLLLPSGYQTAHAVVQTLSGAAAAAHPPRPVRFLLDKLVHASLIDAASAASAAHFRVYPHNHLGKLRRLLATAPAGELQVVLTESIFSMDGDAADLAGLVELKKNFPFVLVLDEAHATGVYGPDGAGYAAEIGLAAHVDVSIITLSKAAGLVGGAICASRAFCDSVTNWGRAYLYSTSVPPFIAAGAGAVIDILRREPWRQQRLRRLARHMRSRLARMPLALAAAGDSPIIPILFHAEEAALNAAAFLRQRGILAVAIRPPTVPRSASRLRITLSCEHRDEEIDQLLAAVEELARPAGLG